MHPQTPSMVPALYYVPTYQPCLPMHFVQLQTQLQTEIHHLQMQTAALQHAMHRMHFSQYHTGRQHGTAASTPNQLLHASSGIANDRHTSHPNRVGGFNSARSGSGRRPPSSEPPKRTAGVQKRRKQTSPIRYPRKCDDLSQYVVANED